jgi:23S rRNA pseudouridine1911/1915/1917 synthase
MLHARILGFLHPRTGQRMTFEREAPDDFRAMLESLRHRGDENENNGKED